MDKHLVTIIIPVYNAEKRLHHAIKSVLNQSYKNIELILVNDGSTDDSLYICQKYAKLDSRIKVINQFNSGVSSARNRGLKESRGEFVMFLDSDDMIDPETITELTRSLDNDSSDLVIFGMSFDYYQEDIFKHNKEQSLRKNATVSSNEFNKYFFEMYDANYLSSACNKMFKSMIIKEYKITFEENMAILEDFKFVLDFMEKSKKITILPNIYYHYYNDLTSSNIRRRPDIDYMRNFKILDFKLREFSEKIGLVDEYSCGKINGMIFRYYIIAIEKLFIEDKKYKYKHEKLKNFMLDENLNIALNKAKPTSTKIKIIKYLFKLKNTKTLSFIFLINSLKK